MLDLEKVCMAIPFPAMAYTEVLRMEWAYLLRVPLILQDILIFPILQIQAMQFLLIQLEMVQPIQESVKEEMEYGV